MSIVKVQICQGAPVTLKQPHIMMGGRVFDIKCAACRRFTPWDKPNETWLTPAMHKGNCKNRVIMVNE